MIIVAILSLARRVQVVDRRRTSYSPPGLLQRTLAPSPVRVRVKRQSMEVVRSKKAQARQSNVDSEERRKTEVRLSMYTQAPSEDVTLEDFEMFAIDRLRGAHGATLWVLSLSTKCSFARSPVVLKGIESALAKGCNRCARN